LLLILFVIILRKAKDLLFAFVLLTTMTPEDLTLLKASIDQVILLETTHDAAHLAQPLFVFDEGETPDLFYLALELGPDGTLIPKGETGYSILLSEILSVRKP